jgi:hypothetical protein
MLARPVVAGPDGSMHHGHYYHDSQSNSIDGDIFSPKMSDDSSRRSHVDWDSVQSVSRVLNEVHQRLGKYSKSAPATAVEFSTTNIIANKVYTIDQGRHWTRFLHLLLWTTGTISQS